MEKMLFCERLFWDPSPSALAALAAKSTLPPWAATSRPSGLETSGVTLVSNSFLLLLVRHLLLEAMHLFLVAYCF